MAHAPFVDSHIHFWDRAVFDYPWLTDTGDALPFRYLPEDLGGQKPEAVVFVQADCLDSQGSAEAEWAAALVRAHSADGAVVAFAPAEDTARLPDRLERLASIEAVTGVRRLLQDEPEDLLRSPELAAGLRRIADAGFSFDACVRHAQLPALVALRRAAPEGELVLDHLGKPPVRDGWGTDSAQRWHSAVRELAAEPRTTVKLSGLAPEGAPGALLDQVRPFVLATLDAFGADRCMAGSDFPVSAAPVDAVGYSTWFDFLAGLTDSARERDSMLRGTARRVYRMCD